MDIQEDKILDAAIKKAFQKITRELKKKIKKEPNLVIELGTEETDPNSSTKSEIRGWLFSRKER